MGVIGAEIRRRSRGEINSLKKARAGRGRHNRRTVGYLRIAIMRNECRTRQQGPKKKKKKEMSQSVHASPALLLGGAPEVHIRPS